MNNTQNTNHIDRILSETDSLLRKIRKTPKTFANKVDLGASYNELQCVVQHLTHRTRSKLEKLADAEAVFFNIPGYLEDLKEDGTLIEGACESADLIQNMLAEAISAEKARIEVDRKVARKARRNVLT